MNGKVSVSVIHHVWGYISKYYLSDLLLSLFKVVPMLKFL